MEVLKWRWRAFGAPEWGAEKLGLSLLKEARCWLESKNEHFLIHTKNCTIISSKRKIIQIFDIGDFR